MAPVIISKAAGLNTQPNELDTQPGSLAVAENVEINRDGVVEVARGFEDFSTNLPDFTPAQLMSVGGTAYLHLDNGIWYYDATSSSWLRKRGAFGSALTSPTGMVYLGGHFYIAAAGSHAIYDYNPSTGSRTILAGRYATTGHTNGTGDAARFDGLWGIATDGTSLYVTETNNHGVRKVTTAGVVTDLAGSATNVSAHTDGTGTAARFNVPRGITWDGSNLYVADKNNSCIRKVTTGGVVTTPYGIADPLTTAAHTEGTGNAARFDNPNGLTNDGTNLYVADTGNNCIRKIVISSGVVTTLAGVAAPSVTSGHTDGTGSAARFSAPYSAYWDGTNLFVPDGINHCIRKVTTAGVVTTPYGVADPGATSGSADGIGNSARFFTPVFVGSDGTDLFVCDYNNGLIRKIYVSTGYVSTIDGVAGFPQATTGIPLVQGAVLGPP